MKNPLKKLDPYLNKVDKTLNKMGGFCTSIFLWSCLVIMGIVFVAICLLLGISILTAILISIIGIPVLLLILIGLFSIFEFIEKLTEEE